MTLSENTIAGTDGDDDPNSTPRPKKTQCNNQTGPSPNRRGGGPQTPEGKKRSSQNTRKLGVFSKSPVIGDERQEDWDALVAGLFESLKPLGLYEELLVRDIALYRVQRARLDRFMNEIVQNQFAAFKLVTRDSLGDRFPDLPEDEVDWLEHDPLSAAVVPEAFDKGDDDAVLGGELVEPFLHALTRICPKDFKIQWPGLPDGQSAGEFTGWTVGLVRKCVDAVAAKYGEDPKELLAKTRIEIDNAGMRQMMRYNDHVRRQQAERTQALIPPQAEMEKHIRYATFLEKQERLATGRLEGLQRGRNGNLPPALRLDIQ